MNRYGECELDAVAVTLNGKPRKTLGGRRLPRRSKHYYLPPDQPALRRLLEPRQYVSIRYSERLAKAGVELSVDSYDNALAKINGIRNAD